MVLLFKRERNDNNFRICVCRYLSTNRSIYTGHCAWWLCTQSHPVLTVTLVNCGCISPDLKTLRGTQSGPRQATTCACPASSNHLYLKLGFPFGSSLWANGLPGYQVLIPLSVALSCDTQITSKTEPAILNHKLFKTSNKCSHVKSALSPTHSLKKS